MAWSFSSSHHGLFVGEWEGALGFSQVALSIWDFFSIAMVSLPARITCLLSFLGIPELEIFTGLGFRVALVYFSLRVYEVACSSFKWTLVERFDICLGRGCTITCNGVIAHSFPIIVLIL